MSYHNNTISLPDAIQDIICKPIDPTLIKVREVSKMSMSYISGSTVVDMLNKAFDYMWDWEVERAWIEDSTPYFNKYSKEKIDTYNGIQGAWEQQGPVAHVLGKLTVRFMDENNVERKIVKSGFGSKCIIGKQSEQDSIYKAADTDALKKAASRIGIGNELYRSEEEQALFLEAHDPFAWTDEMLSKFDNQIQYMANVFSNVDQAEQVKIMQRFNADFTNWETDINPVNIEAFVEYLRNYLAEQEKKPKLNFELK